MVTKSKTEQKKKGKVKVGKLKFKLTKETVKDLSNKEAKQVKGGFIATGKVWCSDVRLKTDITNLRYGLSEVLRLRPVTWTWKDRPETELGLIAQDVKPVLPELVGTVTDKDEMLGINYLGLLPIILKAIQEQQETIISLRNEITALKRENPGTSNKTIASLAESIGTTNIRDSNLTA